MRHLQTKVGHLHTMGHKERYVGSLFRVDEPVPDDSFPVECPDFVIIACCFIIRVQNKRLFMP